jgi:hypothetical protein
MFDHKQDMHSECGESASLTGKGHLTFTFGTFVGEKAEKLKRGNQRLKMAGFRKRLRAESAGRGKGRRVRKSDPGWKGSCPRLFAEGDLGCYRFVGGIGAAKESGRSWKAGLIDEE